MKWFVYIIYSPGSDLYYVGQTNNVENRLYSHNHSNSQFTSKHKPWELKCSIEKQSRSEAVLLEQKVKNLSRERLERFIEKYG